MTGLRTSRVGSESPPVVGERATPEPTPPVITLDMFSSDGRVVIAVGGEVDLLTAPQLGDALDRVTAAGPRHVVVDLRKVSFFDGRGLSVLARARGSLPPGGSFCVVTGLGLTRQLFAITGLDEEIRLHSSLSEALADSASPRGSDSDCS